MHGGPPDEQGPLAALQAFGASAEQLQEARAALRQRAKDATVLVFPCNWQAVKLFCLLEGNWRWRPNGYRDGIDRAALPATLVMMGVPRRSWPALFGKLKIMEAAALEALE